MAYKLSAVRSCVTRTSLGCVLALVCSARAQAMLKAVLRASRSHVREDNLDR